MSDKEQEIPVKVVDRRWWANPEGASADRVPAGGLKPTYVEQLEAQIAEKDRQAQEYLAKYRHASAEFDEARLRLRKEITKDIERARPDFAEHATGTVRVASGPLTIRFIDRRLPELLDELPGIEIELASSYSLINLSRREADIALRNRRPEEGRLAMRGIPQPSYAVFGAKTYVARHPAAATEARYEQCRWIGFDDTRGHSESFQWLCARIGRVPHIRCSNASTILDALINGAGLAVSGRF